LLLVFQRPFGEHAFFSCIPMTAANQRNTAGLSCFGDALGPALENKHTNYSWLVPSWAHLYQMRPRHLSHWFWSDRSFNTEKWW